MSKLLIELNAHISIVKDVSKLPYDSDVDVEEITDDTISEVHSALEKMFYEQLLNADIYRTAYTTQERS
tara:strand:+ start:102 stop:308 length:207 start_codon:yes stop_codon:yes gene_type:complete